MNFEATENNTENVKNPYMQPQKTVKTFPIQKRKKPSEKKFYIYLDKAKIKCYTQIENLKKEVQQMKEIVEGILAREITHLEKRVKILKEIKGGK